MLRRLILALFAAFGLTLIGCGDDPDVITRITRSELAPRWELMVPGGSDGVSCDDDACGVESSHEVTVTFADESDFVAAQELVPQTHPRTSSERLRERARNAAPQDLVRFRLELEEPPNAPSPRGIVALTDNERLDWRAHREATLAPIQDDVTQAIEGLGGMAGGRTLLTNGLFVVAPAEVVDAILAIPGVLRGSPDDVNGRTNGAYRGQDIAIGTLSENLNDYGFDGEGPTTQNTDNVDIAVLDYNQEINCSHVGWDDFAGGSSRIVEALDCKYVPYYPYYTCIGSACSTTNASSHATTVLWVAGGSIEQGQDSAYSTTSTREDRSGVVQESRLFFYNHTSTCGLVAALERVVLQGVDVAVLPFDYGAECNLAYDSCGLNADLSAAFSAGLALVGAPGNDGTSGCRIGWPSTRSEVMAIGGTDTSDDGDAWISTLRHLESVGGSTSGTNAALQSISVKFISLMGPHNVAYNFSTGSSGSTSYNTNGWLGTSFAAPAVGGIVGQVKEWMESFSWSSANEAGALHVNTMVMGDSYNGSLFGDYDSRYAVTDGSGFGRILAHYPSSTDLGSEYAWKSRFTTIYDGATVEWSIGSTLAEGQNTKVKAALYWTDETMSYISKLGLRAVDKCPSGGGQVTIQSASSSDYLRKRLDLEEYQIAGKCVWIQVTGDIVGSGGQPFWAASYKYSNAYSLH